MYPVHLDPDRSYTFISSDPYKTLTLRHDYDEYWNYTLVDINTNSFWKTTRPFQLTDWSLHKLFKTYGFTPGRYYSEVPLPEVEESPVTEYVYVISDGIGHYKIGRSNSPFSRMAHFQAGNALTLKLELMIPTINSNDLESSLHKKFADKRIHGEWFSLTRKDLNHLHELRRKFENSQST